MTTGLIEWTTDDHVTSVRWRDMSAIIEESDGDWFWIVYKHRAHLSKPIDLKELTYLGDLEPKSLSAAKALCEAIMTLNAIADGMTSDVAYGGLDGLSMVGVARMALGRTLSEDKLNLAVVGRAWKAKENKLAKARRKVPYGK